MTTIKMNNGYHIPQLGLGTWQSPPGEVRQAVLEALRLGYRHIDCAWVYRNENEIGDAIAEAIDAGILKREELFVTSKLWNSFHRDGQVRKGLEESLASLKLDYLDLFLIHWPVAFKEGVFYPRSIDDYESLDDVPLIETWHAMENLISTGLVKSIGVSNFSVSKIETIMRTATINPVVNQVEMHPLLQQQDLYEYCRSEDILLTAYSPLGSTAKTEDAKAVGLREHSEVAEIAKSHHASPAQVLIAWALQRGTIVIPKSVTPSRIDENFKAQSLVLSDLDMQRLNQLDKGYRFVSGDFFSPGEKGYTLEALWG